MNTLVSCKIFGWGWTVAQIKTQDSDSCWGKSHKTLVGIYGSAIFLLKKPRKVLPIFVLSIKRIFSRKTYVFNLATPTHTNIGDQMIVFGMEKWCEEYLPNFVYREYDDGIYEDWSFFTFLKLVIKKRDFIFLRGGGSVSDRYIGYEHFVRHVLKSYPKNKIIMFPQSVGFSNTTTGHEEKTKTAAAYDAHPEFTLYTRDKTSFSIAEEMFSHTKVRLCPDIALFFLHSSQPKQYARKGLFLCMRTDTEAFYDKDDLEKLIFSLQTKYDLRFGDTGSGHRIDAGYRETEIENLMSLFSKSKVAVTDRFHGVISAVLTGTPVVALRSADHKIVSGIEWFKNSNYVFYAESPKDVPALVEKAMRCESITTPDFRPYFDKIYEGIMHG